jgi:DNA polymerase phi
MEDDDDKESVDDERSASSDEDDENDENEEVQELRRKIEETFKGDGAATGDPDEESDNLMDDDQMMAIDGQLAQVFRLRVNEKKSSKGWPFHLQCRKRTECSS